MPSSATNSSTPQCVNLPVVVFSTLNSMGYSMCSEAAGGDAVAGQRSGAAPVVAAARLRGRRVT
jgi:hypothetical protein